MKKVFFSMAIGGLLFTSCEKFKKVDEDGMISYAAKYGQTVTVPSTDFEVEEVTTLQRTSSNMPYTSGELKYSVGGNEVAKIDFSHGNEYQALVSKNGDSETVSLGEDKGDKWDYDKVIAEPLVYSEECGYVVSGLIKFYKDGKWVASFDYGDGTCDDLIAKTTEKYENYLFSMNEYPEWNN